MEFTMSGLTGAIRATLRDPRAGARAVLALRLSAATGWSALLLMAVLSTLLTSVSIALAPPLPEGEMARIFANPLQLAVMQMVVMALGAMLVARVGNWFGGKGDLAGALAVMAWLEVILIVVQAAQVVLALLAPPLAEALGLAGAVLFLWLLSHFVAELHGFGSAVRVLGGILLTGFGLSLVLSALLIGFGGMPDV